MASYEDALERERALIRSQTHSAETTKEIGVALDRLTYFVQGLDNARLEAIDQAKNLVRQALRQGVDYRTLVGRPLNPNLVRDLAREVGVEVTRKRPLRRETP